jgi:flagellin
MAMNTQRQLGLGNAAASKSMEKLSSGYRINRAGDDAAGLSISEKMRGQIRGLNMASRNAQDGISLIQTAEGALNETHAILQRMRELAVQSANDTNVEIDRSALQSEIDQLATEITRIAKSTEFNTQNLLDGNFAGKFQIGANENQNVELSINAMDSISLAVGQELTASADNKLQNAKGDNVAKFFAKDAIIVTGNAVLNTSVELTTSVVSAGSGVSTTIITSTAIITTSYTESVTAKTAGYYKLDSDGNVAKTSKDKLILYLEADTAFAVGEKIAKGIDVSEQASANSAITTINDALEAVSAERSKLGAFQNRLEHTIKNLDTSAENLQASESRIRDVDMAKEMMEFTKNNILQQAAQAMLAQANQAPQGVLQLLR